MTVQDRTEFVVHVRLPSDLGELVYALAERETRKPGQQVIQLVREALHARRSAETPAMIERQLAARQAMATP